MKLITASLVAITSSINVEYFKDPCKEFEYKCSSIETAQACNSFADCKLEWAKPVQKSKMCLVCKEVTAEALIRFKKNEKKYEKLLLKTCKHCPQKEECEKMITDNWPLIEALIEENVTPDLICSALNMCHQKTETENPYQYKYSSNPILSAGDMLPVAKTILSDHITFSSSEKAERKASQTCDECVRFAVDLQQIPKSEYRLNKFTETVQQICDELPMKRICRVFINKKVLKLIIEHQEPVQVCKEVALCKLDENPTVPDVDGLNSCTDCHTLVDEVRHISSSDIDHFTKMIKSACALLPHPVDELCVANADKFANEAQGTLARADVNEACQEIAMCDAPVLKKYQTWGPSNSALTSKVCDYCEMAVEYLEYALDSDMTSDQMKAGLEALCDQIQPPSLAGQCVAFVEKNWDRIVEDIDMVLDHPDQVCQKLHMCKKQKMLGGPGCTFGPSYWCKNEDTMKECDVPEDYCKNKVQAPPMPDECTYGPAYWCKDEETIKKCHAEDFCKKKSEKLLGATKCTYGPSYWCKSDQSARDCDAVAYCENVHWKK